MLWTFSACELCDFLFHLLQHVATVAHKIGKQLVHEEYLFRGINILSVYVTQAADIFQRVDVQNLGNQNIGGPLAPET